MDNFPLRETIKQYIDSDEGKKELKEALENACKSIAELDKAREITQEMLITNNFLFFPKNTGHQK